MNDTDRCLGLKCRLTKFSFPKMNSSNVCEQEESNDRFSFLGDARFATLCVSGISLFGILIFLAIPIPVDRTVMLIMKSYYTLSAAIIIFGYICIIKYNPIGITIYTIFYTITALLSTFLSCNGVYDQIAKFKHIDQCDPLVNDCSSKLKVILLMTLQLFQILFWIVATCIVIRFYLRFNYKYQFWKRSYQGEQGPDAFFQHWCYRNQIECRSKTTTSAALDSIECK